MRCTIFNILFESARVYRILTRIVGPSARLIDPLLPQVVVVVWPWPWSWSWPSLSPSPSPWPWYFSLFVLMSVHLSPLPPFAYFSVNRFLCSSLCPYIFDPFIRPYLRPVRPSVSASQSYFLPPPRVLTRRCAVSVFVRRSGSGETEKRFLF